MGTRKRQLALRGPAAIALLLAVQAMPAAAQFSGNGSERDAVRDEALVVAGNMALGGLTAGLRQWRGDGSFLDGFWRGALGGAGIYAGKRITVADGFEAGLFGRAIAATGASVTRNASEGRPSFERLVVPIGPVRIRWWPTESVRKTSIDLAAVGTIAWAFLGSTGASIDLGRSLSTGAPVFIAQETVHWSGLHASGVILLSHSSGSSLAHERVHLLQYDQAFILWGEPLERRLLEGLGMPERWVDRFDFSLHGPVVLGLNQWISREHQPWEFEANALAETW